MKTQHLKRMALAAALVAILAVPVQRARATITDTFYGHVIASDAFGDVSTADVDTDFSTSASTVLVGDTFTLTYTYANPGAGTSYFVGGVYYGDTAAKNPISMTLKVDGLSKTVSITHSTIGASSDASTSQNIYGNSSSGINDYIQAFTYANQLQGKNATVQLTTLALGTPDLSKALPGMQASDLNLANTYAVFFDQSGSGEYLALNIQSVNEPIAVPEPTTILAGVLTLLPFGASTLRILRKRQAA
jgi:hypothetical protein